ncbi:MAG: hypothetical protein K2I91_06270 [Muribaculaceae bacterium]|nr:hypothetical protein [Muribaculaceae bacterium]
MSNTVIYHTVNSSSFEKGWRKYDDMLSNSHDEYDTIEVGNTLMKLYRNENIHVFFRWKDIALPRQHSYIRYIADTLRPITIDRNKWSIKHIEHLSAGQRSELDKLNIGIHLSTERLIFGEVSDNQTTCIALDLGYGIRVRITAYYGDFDTYYLSFFEGDDIIRQEHLDLDNTIAGINNVLRELHREAARRNVTI